MLHGFSRIHRLPHVHLASGFVHGLPHFEVDLTDKYVTGEDRYENV